MWNRLLPAKPGAETEDAAFCRFLLLAALSATLILGTATLALAAPDRDNNPPGPRGGPGTNWENPPGPRGGPGASPDPKPWRPWIWRRIFNANNPTPPPLPWQIRKRIDNDDNPPGPRGGRGTNWENPPGPRGGPGASPDPKPWRPWVRRRIHNAQNPATPPGPWTRRRIHNAMPMPRPIRIRPMPQRRIGGVRRR